MPKAQNALHLDDKSYKIYALIDPRDDVVRYVGITINVQVRLYGHLTNSIGGNLRVKQWITELHQEGISPNLHILETINADIDSHPFACERE